jgi:hypothetical protein
MFHSGYGASKREPQAPAERRPPWQAAIRLADKPILWWWSSLFVVSVGNLILWGVIARVLHGPSDLYVTQQLWLSGIFAAACAFRSALPRVDLERQCLWDSPLSSIATRRHQEAAPPPSRPLHRSSIASGRAAAADEGRRPPPEGRSGARR